MSKKCTYFLFPLIFLLSGLSAFGQDKRDTVPVKPKANTTQQAKSDDDDDDTESDESLSSTKVMVIPFNPSYYTEDVEKEYSDSTIEGNKKAEIAKDWANFGLDKNVKARIVSSGAKQKADLNDYSADSDNDLNKIYENISYQYEKRDKRYEQKNSLIGSLLKRLQTSQKAKEAYQSDDKHKEYLNVVIKDPNLLPKLSEKYGVEIFVFINQYEIFTNYKKVIDPVNKIYQRQVKLHFSIFNGSGEQIYGDVATLAFPSFSKDIDEIILNRFPVVANYISAAFKNAPADGSNTTQGGSATNAPVTPAAMPASTTAPAKAAPAGTAPARPVVSPKPAPGSKDKKGTEKKKKEGEDDDDDDDGSSGS